MKEDDYMLFVKIMDVVCHLLNEFVYALACLVVVAYRFVKTYQVTIVVLFILATLILGGLFGYCFRMAQIYGI